MNSHLRVAAYDWRVAVAKQNSLRSKKNSLKELPFFSVRLILCVRFQGIEKGRPGYGTSWNRSMPVELTIERQTRRLETDTVGIGRSPENLISLPGDVRLEPFHATLKQVSGRWIIESRDGGPIRIGTGRPVQFAWLSSGDTIHLTESGPEIEFRIPETGASQPSPQVPMATPAATRGTASPVRPTATPPPIPQTPKIKAGESSSASFIPAEDAPSWKPILAVGSVAALVVGLFGWIVLQRPTPTPSVADVVSPLISEESDRSNTKQVTSPTLPIQSQVQDTSRDPSDLLVLIGVGDLSDDNRPHLVGVGWLWNSRTVVIPRVLGKNLDEIVTVARTEKIVCQVCVIQGTAIEVDQIIHSPGSDEISLLRLRQNAEILFNPRDIFRRVTSSDVELMRQRGKAITYCSFAKFPKAPKTSGNHGISLVAYEPKYIRMKKEDASTALEYINRGHVLKPGATAEPTERGGLLVDQDQKIIGMTLLESSVLWTADLDKALEK